jgi:hypothetical protein
MNVKTEVLKQVDNNSDYLFHNQICIFRLCTLIIVCPISPKFVFFCLFSYTSGVAQEFGYFRVPFWYHL